MSTKQTAKGPSATAKKPKPPFIVQYFDPEIRAKDPSGHDLDDVLNYSDNQISRKHDFIQYLFPLPEQSMVNPWAPLITKDVYEAFHDRDELRAELLQGLLRMLNFYGFEYSTSESDSSDKKIVPASNFKEQSKYSWRTSMDHNHLRLTRIIRCLRVLSCEKEAQTLHQALLEHDTSNVVRKSTRMFWARAAERPLWLPPDEPDDDAEGIAWLRDVADARKNETTGTISQSGEIEEANASADTGNANEARQADPGNANEATQADPGNAKEATQETVEEAAKSPKASF